MKKTLICTAVTVAFLLVSEVALAGYGTVHGEVVDESGDPIPDAVVSTSMGSDVVSAFTEGQYGFYLLNLLVGTGFDITASAPGYESVTEWNVDVFEYSFTEVNFVLNELEPEPAEPAVWGVSADRLTLDANSHVATFRVYGRGLGIGTAVTAVFHGASVDNEIAARMYRTSATSARVLIRALPDAIAGRPYRLIIESESRGPIDLPVTVDVGN